MPAAIDSQSEPETGNITSTPGVRRLALYVSIIAAIPVALLLLSVTLVISPLGNYIDMGTVSTQRELYTARNRACDILMFGDSSAMAGLDPRLISAKTHLNACNIAVPASAITAVGLLPLDLYLQRNPRPKYLLLQFSPMDMSPTLDGPKDPHVGIEAYNPMLRYGYADIALPRMLARPDMFIMLMAVVYGKGPQDLFKRITHAHPGAITSVPDAGSYIIVSPTASIPCQFHQKFESIPIGPRNIAWIQQTRRRYSQYADNVIINSAPVSDCDTMYRQWSSALSGVLDSPVKVYPDSSFADRFHTTRSAAIRLSEETADQILALEKRASSASAARSAH